VVLVTAALSLSSDDEEELCPLHPAVIIVKVMAAAMRLNALVVLWFFKSNTSF
jgi:hypothetical protein